MKVPSCYYKSLNEIIDNFENKKYDAGALYTAYKQIEHIMDIFELYHLQENNAKVKRLFKIKQKIDFELIRTLAEYDLMKKLKGDKI